MYVRQVCGEGATNTLEASLTACAMSMRAPCAAAYWSAPTLARHSTDRGITYDGGTRSGTRVECCVEQAFATHTNSTHTCEKNLRAANHATS